MRCGTVCVQLSLHCIVCAVVEWHCFFVLKFEAAASKFVCQLHVMKKVVKDVGKDKQSNRSLCIFSFHLKVEQYI